METETVADRLRQAIERWGSIRKFARQMADRVESGEGATRSMIHRYLRPDGPPPNPAFLAAAADLLGVPLSWLRDGAAAVSREPSGAEQELERAFPYLWVSPTVRQAVSAAWLSVVRDRTQRDEGYLLAVGQLAPEAEYPPELVSRSDEHHRAAAEALGSALTSTLHALGVDVRDLRADQLEGFVRAFSLAVSFLFPEPTRYSAPIGAVMARDQKGAA